MTLSHLHTCGLCHYGAGDAGLSIALNSEFQGPCTKVLDACQQIRDGGKRTRKVNPRTGNRENNVDVLEHSYSIHS